MGCQLVWQLVFMFRGPASSCTFNRPLPVQHKSYRVRGCQRRFAAKKKNTHTSTPNICPVPRWLPTAGAPTTLVPTVTESSVRARTSSAEIRLTHSPRVQPKPWCLDLNSAHRAWRHVYWFAVGPNTTPECMGGNDAVNTSGAKTIS